MKMGSGVYGEKLAFNKKFAEYCLDCKLVSERRFGRLKLGEYGEKRGYSLDLLDKLGVFYVGVDGVELANPRYFDYLSSFGVLGSDGTSLYRDRYMFPIRDERGDVQGLVGYSFGDSVKYLFAGSRFYERSNTLYGMENYRQVVGEGYYILVEGITDCVSLRQISYDCSLGRCGTFGSKIVFEKLNRCRDGGILLCDRDRAGFKALEKWKKEAGKGILCYVPVGYKDVDSFLYQSGDKGAERVKQALNVSIEYLRSGKLSGFEEITI